MYMDAPLAGRIHANREQNTGAILAAPSPENVLIACFRENSFSMPSESVKLTTGYWQLLLTGLLHDRQVHIALLNHLSRDLKVLDTFLAGQVVHQVKH